MLQSLNFSKLGRLIHALHPRGEDLVAGHTMEGSYSQGRSGQAVAIPVIIILKRGLGGSHHVGQAHSECGGNTY